MDKQPIHQPSRFKRFISGRGFYVALAACLLAIGGVTVATFGERMFVRQPADSSDSVSDTRPVEQKVSDQPDERKTTTTTTAATTSAATTTTAPAADLYVLPLGNTLQQPYSGTELLYSVTMQDWRTHEGADFAGEQGQAVKALADGRVTAVESDVFWGERVTIDHGTGVQSTYCGLKPTVKAGDTVKVGETIGTLSAIPCEQAQGLHLHLEMTVDGRTVDPVQAIGREVRYADGSAPTQATE